MSGQINPEVGKKHCAYYPCSVFFLLSSSLCLSDYLRAGQASVCVKRGCVCLLAVSPCPECVSRSETSALCEWVLTRSRWERVGSVTVLSTLWNILTCLIYTADNTHSQLLMVHSSWCHNHCNPSLSHAPSHFSSLAHFFLYISACIVFLCKYMYHKIEKCCEYWLAAQYVRLCTTVSIVIQKQTNFNTYKTSILMNSSPDNISACN